MVEILDTKPKKEKEEELEVELISFNRLKDYANGKTARPLESFKVMLVGENEVKVTEKKDMTGDAEDEITSLPDSESRQKAGSSLLNAPMSLKMPEMKAPHFSLPRLSWPFGGNSQGSGFRGGSISGGSPRAGFPDAFQYASDAIKQEGKSGSQTANQSASQPVKQDPREDRELIGLGLKKILIVIVVVLLIGTALAMALPFVSDITGGIGPWGDRLLSIITKQIDLAKDPDASPRGTPTGDPRTGGPIDYSSINIQRLVANNVIAEKNIILEEQATYSAEGLYKEMSRATSSLENGKIYFVRIYEADEELAFEKAMSMLGIKMMPQWQQGLKEKLIDYRLLLYRESEAQPRLGLLCIFDKEETITTGFLGNWEATIADDLKGLYWPDHQGKVSMADKSFRSSSISERRRFVNFADDQSLSLDYAVAKDGLIVVTSKNFGTKLLEILLGHEQ